MEEKRCRRNSVSSVHSQSNYSIANVQCSEDHTHAIVQREKDNKVILVPLDCFINFGKTVKVSETATYKSTMGSRKSERGKVLLFGSEDLCVEQLQVIQEENIEEGQLSEKTKQIDDRFDTFRSKKINSASSITVGPPTRYEKKASQLKRKLFDDNNEFLSTNENILEEPDPYAFILPNLSFQQMKLMKSIIAQKKTKFNNLVANDLSAKRTNDVNHQILSKKLTSTASSNQARSQSVLKPLKHEDALPNAGARSWFINLGKRLGEQLSAKTICEHAELINNINANVLLTCIEDRGTATVRQIIRALYSEEQLSGKTGPNAVSKQLREAIR
ncbi:unnamed protein product, partial [Rotaria sp. Silwood2]